jgi:hypothetical protein
MAQRNRATTRIHILAAQTQDLGVGFDDGGEGFVEFPDGDVFFFEAGLRKEFLDARGGGDGEVDWVC